MTTKTNKPKPPKIVQCPIDSVPYLMVSIMDDHCNTYGYLFGIKNDLGTETSSNEKESNHLKGHNWIIIEREP